MLDALAEVLSLSTMIPLVPGAVAVPVPKAGGTVSVPPVMVNEKTQPSPPQAAGDPLASTAKNR